MFGNQCYWVPCVIHVFFPRLGLVIFSSVHVVANVGKCCSCVCDSLEVTTDKTDKDADD